MRIAKEPDEKVRGPTKFDGMFFLLGRRKLSGREKRVSLTVDDVRK